MQKYVKMQKNASVLVIVCLLLCLALHYTFPLHRAKLKRSSFLNSEYLNNSWHWDDFLHHKSFVERSKKMTNDIENAIKKFKTSAQDIGRNMYHDNTLKKESDKLSEEDLRHYERLVIMKKYPYLDLKDLENKYSPLSMKNTRQSLGVVADSNFRSVSNLCEPDDSINVEIINRGLSGFSIPQKITKSVEVVENKVKTNNMKNNDEKLESEVSTKLTKKSAKRQTLDGLQKDIYKYEMKRNIKLR